jgi:hypothetical protein
VSDPAYKVLCIEQALQNKLVFLLLLSYARFAPASQIAALDVNIQLLGIFCLASNPQVLAVRRRNGGNPFGRNGVGISTPYRQL